MAQKTSTTQPQPAIQPVAEETLPAGSSRKAKTLRELAAAQKPATAVEKQQFMGDIRQKLAQVADEAKKHGEEAKETEMLAANAATRLYLARRDGVLNAEELNGLLGDVFGYTPKQDGTPGKTPAGTGRVIRMRVVRGLQGHDFVNGGDGGRFFESMDVSDVAPIINSIGAVKEVNGETVPDGPTIWQAYKLLGDIKSQKTVRLDFAFDAKKIGGLSESLSEAGAQAAIASNPALLTAYIGLFDQLDVILNTDYSEPADETETEAETEMAA